MKTKKESVFWTLLRISMGWIFFWPFIDKLFGLGFSTKAEKAWIHGGSPTSGFLNGATKGPLEMFYKQMVGSNLVDWLFMLGLLFVGVSLLLGVFVLISSYIGSLMLILMYTAGFMPPANNPFLDEHIVFTLVLIGLSVYAVGQKFGFGYWWTKTGIVRRFNFLG